MDKTNGPQLLMPLFTEANRAEAHAGSPNWDASDDVMYDMMIMLSGKDIDDVMRAADGTQVCRFLNTKPSEYPDVKWWWPLRLRTWWHHRWAFKRVNR
jgi:hypothetical protein